MICTFWWRVVHQVAFFQSEKLKSLHVGVRAINSSHLPLLTNTSPPASPLHFTQRLCLASPLPAGSSLISLRGRLPGPSSNADSHLPVHCTLCRGILVPPHLLYTVILFSLPGTLFDICFLISERKARSTLLDSLGRGWVVCWTGTFSAKSAFAPVTIHLSNSLPHFWKKAYWQKGKCICWGNGVIIHTSGLESPFLPKC